MKTMVITGASRGLGRNIVLKFLETGNWIVYGLSRTDSKIVHKNYIEKISDIRNYESIKASVSDIKNVDLLINNAAVYSKSLLQNMKWSTIEDILTTNTLGTINVTYSLLPVMPNRSRIINISSVAATHPIKYESVYSASKKALDGFFDSLELELEDKKIFITTLYPGGINTTLWNTHNPYDGDTKTLLDPDYIASYILSMVNEPNIVFKKITLHPITEQH